MHENGVRELREDIERLEAIINEEEGPIGNIHDNPELIANLE